MVTKSDVTMDDLLEKEQLDKVGIGELLEGQILSIHKHRVWVDLDKYGLGMVVKREIGQGRKLNVGESVNVSVVDPEMEDGTVLVSLRKAAKDHGWDVLKEIMDSKESIEVEPYDANRGGLLIEYEGVRGFMPVSQLTAEHYPRVSGADKDEILQKLHSLVDKPIKVRVLDVDRKQSKLIFSEKEAVREDIKSRLDKINVGDTVDGTVTGVADFGAFVNVSGIEGLIHISEISWERIDDPGKFIKAGQQITAKIIAVDNDRLSLSIKQLLEDPWVKEVAKFKAGDIVEGTITRITPFGAFVQISPAVEALAHVSTIGESDDTNTEEVFKLDQKKQFEIIEIDESARKVSLKLGGKKKEKNKK